MLEQPAAESTRAAAGARRVSGFFLTDRCLRPLDVQELCRVDVQPGEDGVQRPDWNVSQAPTVPSLRPRVNHSVRWLAEPCVQLSGFTRWPEARWRRSSPTAAAAASPFSTSPFSRMF